MNFEEFDTSETDDDEENINLAEMVHTTMQAHNVNNHSHFDAADEMFEGEEAAYAPAAHSIRSMAPPTAAPPANTMRNLAEEFETVARDEVNNMERIENLRKRLQGFNAAAEATQKGPPTPIIPKVEEADLAEESRAKEVYLRSLGQQKEMIAQWHDVLRQVRTTEIADRARNLQRQREILREEETIMEVRRRELDCLVSTLHQRERELGREVERVATQLQEPSFKEQEARLEEKARTLEARMEEMHRLHSTIEERRQRMRHKEIDLDTRERQMLLKESEWSRRVRDIERHHQERTSDVERREGQVASWMRALEVRERDLVQRETQMRRQLEDLAQAKKEGQPSAAAPKASQPLLTAFQRAEDLFAIIERLDKANQARAAVAGPSASYLGVEELDHSTSAGEEDDDTFGDSPPDHTREGSGSTQDPQREEEDDPNVELRNTVRFPMVSPAPDLIIPEL